MLDKLRHLSIRIINLTMLGYAYANLLLFALQDKIMTRRGLVDADRNVGQTVISLTVSAMIALLGTTLIILWLRNRKRRDLSGGAYPKDAARSKTLGQILDEGLSQNDNKNRD